jgi:hypothetical protein
LTFSTTTEPSTPALLAIWRRGSSRAFLTSLTPVSSSPSALTLSMASMAFIQSGTAAGYYTFFNCGFGRCQSIFDAVLLLLEFGFGGCAYLNYGYSADSLAILS